MIALAMCFHVHLTVLGMVAAHAVLVHASTAMVVCLQFCVVANLKVMTVPAWPQDVLIIVLTRSMVFAAILTRWLLVCAMSTIVVNVFAILALDILTVLMTALALHHHVQMTAI